MLSIRRRFCHPRARGTAAFCPSFPLSDCAAAIGGLTARVSGRQLAVPDGTRSGDDAPGGCSGGLPLCKAATNGQGGPVRRNNDPRMQTFLRKTADRGAAGENAPDAFIRRTRVISLPKRGLYGCDGRTNQRGPRGAREGPGGTRSRTGGSDPRSRLPARSTSGSTARWSR